MTAYDRSREVEAESMRRLQPWLRREYDGLVMARESPLALFLQKQHGDMLANIPHTGRLLTIECKAEREWTGNIPFEVFSNYTVERPDVHRRLGLTMGWLFNCHADILLFHYLSNNAVVVLPWLKAQASILGLDDEQRMSVLGRQVLKQPRIEQPNDTRFFVIPAKELKRTGFAYEFTLNQLELFEQHTLAAVSREAAG